MSMSIIRTNKDTLEWIEAMNNSGISARQWQKEAESFFGLYVGTHKTFTLWKEKFRRSHMMKKNM